MLTKSNVSSFSLIPVLFVLTLFLLLSALSISVILAGSTVYEKISDNMDNNYDRRVTFSYLTTKIRQNDSNGSISIVQKEFIEHIDGKDIVKIVDMIAIKESELLEYITYIYYYEGYIREIFTDIEFEPGWGEEIIKAEGFEFRFSDNEHKIEMKLTDVDGKIQATKVYLRSQK